MRRSDEEANGEEQQQEQANEELEAADGDGTIGGAEAAADYAAVGAPEEEAADAMEAEGEEEDAIRDGVDS